MRPAPNAPVAKRNSGTQPVVRETDDGALRRELARLRRENQLLKSQLRSPTPLPRAPRRGAVTPGSLTASDVVGGRYQLDRLLARGGMGAVWVARDLDTGEQVALKFLKEGAAPEHIARFVREAEICQLLASEHVVRVLSDGVDGGNHYIAMELLLGESLSSLLRQRRRLTLPEVTQLVGDIRAALEPAHQLGIVHRDLKPQNLFLTVQPNLRRSLKLLDFGVAKALDDDDDMTQTGCIIGSPNYMSPEQARGVAVDHRCDLWSVAVILYRALTGERPWASDNPLELLLRICTVTPPPPSKLVPGLPLLVDRFFERAFSEQIGDRFQTISELAAAFAIASKSTSMPPPLAPRLHSPVPSRHSLDPTGMDDISLFDSVDDASPVSGSTSVTTLTISPRPRPRWLVPLVVALVIALPIAAAFAFALLRP